jgi:hypothetical protein
MIDIYKRESKVLEGYRDVVFSETSPFDLKNLYLEWQQHVFARNVPLSYKTGLQISGDQAPVQKSTKVLLLN